MSTSTPHKPPNSKDAVSLLPYPSRRTRTSVLVIGHGSRDQSANEEFENLVGAYRDSHPEYQVYHCYIELAHPSLATALATVAENSDEVIAVPLFLFGAGHLKNDIPIALASARGKYPHVRFVVSRELGVHPILIDLAFERVSACLRGQENKKNTAIIVVGRGASDPDANGDFYKLVRLLGEGRNFSWVMPCFIGITRPLFDETAELLSRARPDRILVLPYFLFGGLLIAKLRSQIDAFAKQHPWISIQLGNYLGPERTVLNLIDERIRQALYEAQPLPCDNCQYRYPVSGVIKNVGGLRALLWSIRHMFTHTQAAPHTHAHRALNKHVLVCGNVDCAARGSIALISKLRRLVSASGRDQEIRVTKTSCMGRCGEGPTVAIYPDGIWYRNVLESDADELVREHLLNDRLVGRLVDNIMQ